jgi:uncharacterized protein involved in outer membrane biogenesis
MAFTGNYMPTSFKVGLMNGVFNFQTGTGCTFTGSTAGGTTLTVSAVASGTLYIGMGITTSAAPNTTIGYITAYGTGNGGAGTYTLSATSTVSSTSMVGGAFFIALYTNSATFDSTTAIYTATNEVSGTGYTATGNQLSVSVTPSPAGPTWSGANTTAYINFSDTTWTTATITARGALIYQNATLTIGGSSLIRPTCAVLDFGSDKSSSASNFTIQFPAIGSSPTGSTAIIRIA